MLIVTLKENEKVLIGNEISVMVFEIRGNQIRLGIEAPAGLLVLREKLAPGGWVKTNPREYHQDAGQTLPDGASCLLCLHSVP
jgi:carbon storage regulator